MNILAINPGHNGSAALLVNGELKFYIEEERLSRAKYDGNPYLGILEALKYGVDFLVIGGTNPDFPKLPWTGEDPYSGLVRKFNPKVKVINAANAHHLGHAAGAFYNSGFEEAAAVIIDGAGTYQEVQVNDRYSNCGFEAESIFNCSYEDGVKRIFQSFGGNDTQSLVNDEVYMDSAITLVKAYEAVSDYLGFGFIEAGKTMGLAPYGKQDPSMPALFINGRGNKNVFIPNYPAGAFIDKNRIPYLNINNEIFGDGKEVTAQDTNWHSDPFFLKDPMKNLAWAVQEETQTLAGDLIEKAVDRTGKKNVVIAGGYGLNCVANYYYKKRFPDLNIYVDPVSHDGGTAIGLAKLVYYSETKEKTKRPLTSLYLGLDRNIQSHMDIEFEIELSKKYEVKNVKTSDVAKLIYDKNIVAIFQGRSEAGPRALGNRSILYDPTDPQGKDVVNKVKGREWFRPFAGSMLQEHFEDWFDTYGMKESPYMMYAMDVKLEKHGEIPAITHVDGTCRIQTVTKKQNEHYYNLIKEFYKLSNVPILFNTSLNLAGQPLVETLKDTIKTMEESDLEYLYLPELGKLVKVVSQQIEEDPEKS
jgi:carbamoyltransferase